MNTSKNADRMEKLRKSRSLNDVVSVIKNIAKDIGRSKNAVARMEAVASATTRKVSTSAGERPTKIRINHDGTGDDIKVVEQKPSSDEGKKGNRAVFRNKKLSGGVSLKNTKYVAPNIKTAEQIQNKVDVVHDLHENLVELDAAREKIKFQFRGAKNLKVALNGIQALQDELQLTLARAYDLLETIAQKHLPAELQAMNSAVADFIAENIPQTKYDSLESEIYVTVKAPTDEDEGVKTKGPKKIKIDVDKADFAFHCYTVIENLKNSGNFEFEQYCIVLTGIVDRNLNIRYFLNALPDFKSPGKFPIGQEITDDHEMQVRMSLLLAHNDVVTEIERKPMPLNTKTAKEKGFHAISGVSEVHVVDDTLRVTLEKTGKPDVVKAEVRSLLTAILGKRNRAKVLPRATHDKAGNVVLIFSLIPDIPDTEDKRDYDLNLSKLRDLQHVLGLPDDVIDDVKHAMLRRT